MSTSQTTLSDLSRWSEKFLCGEHGTMSAEQWSAEYWSDEPVENPANSTCLFSPNEAASAPEVGMTPALVLRFARKRPVLLLCH